MKIPSCGIWKELSVVFWAGMRGGREYLLRFSLFLLPPIKNNSPNLCSPPKGVLKVKHSFSGAHAPHKGTGSGAFC